MKLRIRAKGCMGMVLGCVLSVSSPGQEQGKTAAPTAPEKREPAKMFPPIPGTSLGVVMEPLEYSAQAVIGPQEQAVTTPSKVRLSPWSAEVQKLAQAGIDDEVVLAFIDTAGTFNLTSAQIIQLRDHGVSGPVINGMMQHDSHIISGLRPVIASTVPNSEALLQTGKVQTPPSLASPA